MESKEFEELFRIREEPNYISQGEEIRLFEAAFRSHIPVILKGPTGCGKTRFLEYMSFRLGVPLVTVSCHEDLTASDLTGRYLFIENETVWQDGPLSLAVRYGGICYLDEIVEARKDTTVVIHSLTDDRRMLFIERTDEMVKAHENFMMVLSYNPGYQSVVKELKQSTKQRFVNLVFSYPDEKTEARIIESETGIDRELSEKLAELGLRLRKLKGYGLDEGVSTRLLVYAGRLIRSGLSPLDACRLAIVHSITDAEDIVESLEDTVKLYFGNL